MTQVDRMTEIRKPRISIWGKMGFDDVIDTDESETADHGLSWKLTEK